MEAVMRKGRNPTKKTTLAELSNRTRKSLVLGGFSNWRRTETKPPENPKACRLEHSELKTREP